MTKDQVDVLIKRQRNKVKIENKLPDFEKGVVVSNEDGYFYIYKGVTSHYDYPTFEEAQAALEDVQKLF